mmetsp:Transcript_15605/g.39957  ORF Transcript_15605/g.39957 Transcript_15605/m.39957 type:complete len:456 (+) Transcript_15605:60-1427(+)
MAFFRTAASAISGLNAATSSAPRYILCADIGGTNARFSLYSFTESLPAHPTRADLVRLVAKHQCLYSTQYKNEDHSSFIHIMELFVKEARESQEPHLPGNLRIESACLAVAGPVKDNRVNFTNRGNWLIDAVEIAARFNIARVELLNDFVANGYGIFTLREDDECRVLQEGSFDPRAPIACIGAGTGLGECFLVPTEDFVTTFPTEGGHVEFAPRSDEQMKLLSFLHKKFGGRVSIERVVSGRGLVNVYEFFREEYPDQRDALLDAKIMSESEGARSISENASEDRLCQRSLDLMLEIYGMEVGCVALKYIPYGGLYIAGGIAPKNIHRLMDPHSGFQTAMHDKGRVSDLLSQIPIKVVMAEDLGLRGAHLMAFRSAARSSALGRTLSVALKPYQGGGDDAEGAAAGGEVVLQAAAPASTEYASMALVGVASGMASAAGYATILLMQRLFDRYNK